MTIVKIEYKKALMVGMECRKDAPRYHHHQEEGKPEQRARAITATDKSDNSFKNPVKAFVYHSRGNRRRTRKCRTKAMSIGRRNNMRNIYSPSFRRRWRGQIKWRRHILIFGCYIIDTMKWNDIKLHCVCVFATINVQPSILFGLSRLSIEWSLSSLPIVPFTLCLSLILSPGL